MDYILWSQEYFSEAEKILGIIENLKQKQRERNPDERKLLCEEIIKLRNIYYECLLTSKHLLQRAKCEKDAA